MSLYTDLGLDTTVRVGINHLPDWGAHNTPTGVEHGVPSPHAAANIPCGEALGLKASLDGLFMAYCRKPVGHKQPKNEAKHVPFDYRILASPYPVVHAERFKPNMLPNGVDMSITIPHDCANHLVDVANLEAEAYGRGR